MLQRFIAFLGVYSSAVTALATVINALATIVIGCFSFFSWRIFRWEKEKDRRNRQPVLSFVDELDERGNCRNLYVKNVGYGPAMDIVRNIIRPGALVRTTPDEPLLLGSLGQGEKVYAYCATPPNSNAVPIIDDPQFEAALEYDDVLGNHYEMSYQQRHHSTPLMISQRKIPWSQVARI